MKGKLAVASLVLGVVALVGVVLLIRAENVRLVQQNADLFAEAVAVAVARNEAVVRGNDLVAQHYALRTRYDQLVVQRDGLAAVLETGAKPTLRYRPLACTGSMEPALTCLDLVAWDVPDKPERLGVGTVISYGPGCWEDADGFSHRVIDVKVEDGVQYYWTKGDASLEDDGCWVPHEHVEAYVVAVYMDVYRENAWLRDKVNGSEAAMDVLLDSWWDLDAVYGEALERYCGVGVAEGDCYGRLRDREYNIVVNIWNRLDAAADRYEKAEESHLCWLDVARASKYPGHVPENDCDDMA